MFRGSCVALVTPFKDGKIDEEGLERLLDFHLENGTDAVLLCGTTGEAATLSLEERLRIIEIGVKKLKGKLPILGGCGTNSTSTTIELTKEVKKVGADAGLIVCPYYNKPTQQGLYEHFKKVSDEVDFPIIIYNIPSRTGVNILPQTVIKLVKDCKNIIGIKDAAKDLAQTTKMMEVVSERFQIWSGDDSLTLPMLSIGASGVISVIANILPKEMHDMCHAFLNGEIEKAKKYHLKMLTLMEAMFLETNPIPVKSALEIMGLCSSEVRLPLVRASEKTTQTLRKLLSDYGITRS